MGPNKFDAVIWDMDGLLLDTERISHHCWVQANRELGLGLQKQDFLGIIGMNQNTFSKVLISKLNSELNYNTLRNRVLDLYQEQLDRNVPLKSGAAECIQKLSDLGIPQAVATSSDEKLAQTKLSKAGLLHRIEKLTTGDQVTESKPSPEIFLLAASRLGISAKRCCVFEDSRHGIKAASDAAMFPVLVPDMVEHEEDTTSVAKLILGSLNEALPLFCNWFKTS